MVDNNRPLAEIFRDMSSIYRYIGGEDRFRALAYQKAARSIGSLQTDISSFVENDTLEDIPGIGEHTAGKVREYLKTGKIRKYEELKKEVPHELMDMMQITGFGPQSLKAIHEKLGVSSKGELIKALHDGSISGMKGFGKRKVENMLRGLDLHKATEERMLLWEAIELGDILLKELKQIKEVQHVELAGSLRRRKETIGDIDILVSCATSARRKIVDKFTGSAQTKDILAKGDTKASIILKQNNRQVDLRLINEDEWGAALLYFTGSKEHNIYLRTIAKEMGLKISEYGVFRVKDDKRIAGRTEEEIYKLLGFDWVPPEMREDKGELELAARHHIPDLVELKSIRGDLHVHSDWSDGALSIDDLAAFVTKNYSYDYIALTDHSKSERIAGGMDEKEFLKQIKAIKDVNKKIGKDFIKTGVEVDILADGSLDLSDDLLAQLDWVCASVHSGFKNDATERLIKACQSPYVCCICHPSGRLIGQRSEYPVDWKRVFKVAKETGTALEINAQPQRMDLDDELASAAREAGVMLVINTDSHGQDNFKFMSMGVGIARRAWCTAGDILNTKSWKEVQAFIDRKRKKK
jgi:DNA polymerase (family 10)